MKSPAVLLLLISAVLADPVVVDLKDMKIGDFLNQLKGIGPVLGPAIEPETNNDTPKQKHLLGEDTDSDYHAMLFAKFQRKFGRVYQDQQEMIRRFNIFKNNTRRVAQLQSQEIRSEFGTAQYSVMTPFGDMSEEEFKKTHTMPLKFFRNAPILPQADIPGLGDTPTSCDWRQKGAVTPVKNQGSCGSCWAFSTTGNIEGQWFLSKNKLVSLSEQELVDCDKVDQGCEGGLPSTAYKQIIKLGGLETEKNYPYEGSDDKCEYNTKMSAVYINSSVAISKDEDEMAAWLAKNGPISIGINANAMQFYFGGVAHPWKIFCNPGNLDHGVLIVGYGVEGTTPYWIIKNSWGPSWGEQGYYRVYRGGGVCGLNQMCTSAVVH